jgi:hypothetical protein
MVNDTTKKTPSQKKKKKSHNKGSDVKKSREGRKNIDQKTEKTEKQKTEKIKTLKKEKTEKQKSKRSAIKHPDIPWDEYLNQINEFEKKNKNKKPPEKELSIEDFLGDDAY